ncbi:unnamed protein product [Adineta ricciae]|uniref:Uncharacterized protein n=1 Tax=Adineta ricciae TaxID=249248 RepID=A0A815B287_ADIRI|nr:unnamed protein product [Adineta ricciae]
MSTTSCFSLFLLLFIILINITSVVNLHCHDDLHGSIRLIENCRACVIYIDTNIRLAISPRTTSLSQTSSIEELAFPNERKRYRRHDPNIIIRQRCAREHDGALYGYDQTHCYCNSNRCNSDIQRCIYEIASKRYFSCYHGFDSSGNLPEISRKCRSCRIRMDTNRKHHYECLEFGQQEQNNQTHCTCQYPMCNQNLGICQRFQQKSSPPPRIHLIRYVISNVTSSTSAVTTKTTTTTTTPMSNVTTKLSTFISTHQTNEEITTENVTLSQIANHILSMSKATKLEDYWRDQNLESLLKEITQLLTRRMPSDPPLAIVEFLQKKFPKSFKSSTDSIGIVPKPLAASSQLKTLTSVQSDTHNESMNDTQLGSQLANQSFNNGLVTMPTMGSAFTDLLKNDTSSLSQAPQISMKNLIRAGRLGEQAIKWGKNIRSDHDILEEEVLRPTKNRPTTSTAESGDHFTYDPMTENIQEVQTHDQPTVRQIIKYKQHLRTEKDRRLHREELAKLAQSQREKEEFYRSDLAGKSEENQQQQQHLYEDDSVVPAASTEKSQTKASDKPVVKSKEEEEILNDENIFRPRMQRNRQRQRNKPSTAPDSQRRFTRDFQLITKTEDGNLICKVCGHVINDGDGQLVNDFKVNSAASSARPYEPQQSSQSVHSSSAAVDDWFESSTSASISISQPNTPHAADEPSQLFLGSMTFRRNLFQPITDDNTNMNRLTSPRISESGIFARSPEPRARRPSSSQSITSPATKKHQPDTVTSPQTTRTLVQPSPSRSRPPSAPTTN